MHIHSLIVHYSRLFGSARFLGALILLAAFSLLQLIGAKPASAKLTARANHDRISIDFFYHGGTVSVRGEADAGTDLVIKITSAEGHQVLKRKGKVGGVLWMNVGQLKFEHAPSFYEVFSTKKLDEMLTKEEREKYLIGYPALQDHIEINPVVNEEEKASLFSEFIKYKEATKVYATSVGKIETKISKDGQQEYYILTDWPYQAQPGDYEVAVYAARNGKVVEQAQANVKVEQVGLVKTLATMAKNKAAFYGILSVGIALGAGFGVGLVFRKGGGAH